MIATHKGSDHAERDRSVRRDTSTRRSRQGDGRRTEDTRRAMKVVAIGSEKGGVGKSTTTLYLAAWSAAKLGRRDGRPRVAIVDRDHSRWLSHQWRLLAYKDIGDILLLPDTRLPAAGSGIDLVLIDTPPGADALRSLEEADAIIVPTPPNDWGVDALATYLRTVDTSTTTTGSRTRIVAVLPTFVESRRRTHKQRLSEIEAIAARHRPPLMILPYVRRLAEVEEKDLRSTEYDAAAKELSRHGTI